MLMLSSQVEKETRKERQGNLKQLCHRLKVIQKKSVLTKKFMYLINYIKHINEKKSFKWPKSILARAARLKKIALSIKSWKWLSIFQEAQNISRSLVWKSVSKYQSLTMTYKNKTRKQLLDSIRRQTLSLMDQCACYQVAVECCSSEMQNCRW